MNILDHKSILIAIEALQVQAKAQAKLLDAIGKVVENNKPATQDLTPKIWTFTPPPETEPEQGESLPTLIEPSYPRCFHCIENCIGEVCDFWKECHATECDGCNYVDICDPF
jgi:hypothetical protein